MKISHVTPVSVLLGVNIYVPVVEPTPPRFSPDHDSPWRSVEEQDHLPFPATVLPQEVHGAENVELEGARSNRPEDRPSSIGVFIRPLWRYWDEGHVTLTPPVC